MRIKLRVGGGKNLRDITRNLAADIQAEVQFRFGVGDGPGSGGLDGGGLSNFEPEERSDHERKVLRTAVRSAIARLKGLGQ